MLLAFSDELSFILTKIDEERVPLDYLVFFRDKSIELKEEEKRIKFDNKIIHKSKLLKYFLDENYEIERLEDDLVSLYKKI